MLLGVVAFMLSPFGVAAAVGGTALFAFAGSLPKPEGSLYTAVDIDEIVTNLGGYYREQRNIVFEQYFYGDGYMDFLTPMDGVSDEAPLPSLGIGSVIQVGKTDNTWNPTADAFTIGSRTMKVRHGKVDLSFDPMEIWKSWVGYLKRTGTNPEDLVFEEYFFRMLGEQVKQDLRYSVIWKGSYNASGTTPAAVADGFLEIVADEITATNITPVVTGAVSASTIVDDLLLVHDNLSEAIKNKPTVCHLSTSLFDAYCRKFGISAGAASQLQVVKRDLLDAMPLLNSVRLDGTNTVLVREPGMQTSQRLLIAPMANMLVGFDSMSDFNNIRLQWNRRALEVMVDFKIGTQIADLRYVSCNDAA